MAILHWISTLTSRIMRIFAMKPAGAAAVALFSAAST